MKISSIAILASLCFIVYHVSKAITEWIIDIIDRRTQ